MSSTWGSVLNWATSGVSQKTHKSTSSRQQTSSMPPDINTQKQKSKWSESKFNSFYTVNKHSIVRQTRLKHSKTKKQVVKSKFELFLHISGLFLLHLRVFVGHKGCPILQNAHGLCAVGGVYIIPQINLNIVLVLRDKLVSLKNLHLQFQNSCLYSQLSLPPMVLNLESFVPSLNL